MIVANPTPARRPAWLGFVGAQALLLCAGVAVASFRVVQLDAERRLPKLLEVPRTVTPLHDQPVVISDEQLERVLRKLAPRNMGAKTKINHVDHGLRFWTLQARFADKKLFSGEQLRQILTDTRAFRAQYGDEPKPLLIDTAEGIRVRVQEGPTASTHVDHTMAGLAEVGTPLSFPVVTPTRQLTYRAMVEQALRDFSLNQIEYEWSILTFALFFEPGAKYTTTEGQQMTFDRLARRIMRQELPQGVCFANHRLYTLVALLRLDLETPMLGDDARREIHEYLNHATALLVASQHADGYWDGDWPSGRPNAKAADRRSGDDVADRILATGHALEWWAMAPESFHPPRPVLAAAGQWLVKTIDDLTAEKTEDYFTYLSHAGRALALWRGKWAWQVVHE